MALSPAAVVSGGARVARASGVEAVGVRAVAAELAVTPMALYRHVPSASALQLAVVEHLLEGLPTRILDSDWRQRVRWWALETRRVVGGAHGLARFVLQQWTNLPPALRAVDALGSMLTASGPAGTDTVGAANTLFTYVLMRVQAEEAVRAATERDLRVLGEWREELPFLWRYRHEYKTARIDEHFSYGLEVILAGLAADPPPARRGHRART